MLLIRRGMHRDTVSCERNRRTELFLL